MGDHSTYFSASANVFGSSCGAQAAQWSGDRVNPLQGACLQAQAREGKPRQVEEIRRDAERGGERLLLTSIVDPQNASQRHSALRSAMRRTDGSDGSANPRTS